MRVARDTQPSLYIYQAAGDTYRATYHSLTADPSSLSNLDQDLPNYLQHSLPIHPLPAEWLWCEAWCDDASKPRAKTIDLCNNPMTKEPKLQAASRIIGDIWHELDEAAAAAMATNGSGTAESSSGVAPKEEL